MLKIRNKIYGPPVFKSKEKINKMSLVSIVIPCRNEVKYISNLLNSIRNTMIPLGN